MCGRTRSRAWKEDSWHVWSHPRTFPSAPTRYRGLLTNGDIQQRFCLLDSTDPPNRAWKIRNESRETHHILNNRLFGTSGVTALLMDSPNKEHRFRFLFSPVGDVSYCRWKSAMTPISTLRWVSLVPRAAPHTRSARTASRTDTDARMHLIVFPNQTPGAINIAHM